MPVAESLPRSSSRRSGRRLDSPFPRDVSQGPAHVRRPFHLAELVGEIASDRGVAC
ncbi:hypothetical protein [Streptomyces sp. NPDC058991]|uniref:hypothetical protein n=1 Tax=unclassified Streptomyces TaxID=2593676 RepID=UPI00368B88CC